MKCQITPDGGVGFLVNLEPPGAHGTVHRKRIKEQVSFQTTWNYSQYNFAPE